MSSYFHPHQQPNPPYPISPNPPGGQQSPFYPPTPQPNIAQPQPQQSPYSNSPNASGTALAPPPRSRSSSASHRTPPMQQSPNMGPSLHPASAAAMDPRASPVPIPMGGGSPGSEYALTQQQQPVYGGSPGHSPGISPGHSPGRHSPGHGQMVYAAQRSGSHSSYDDRDLSDGSEDEEEEYRRERRRERRAKRKMREELEARPTLGGSLLSAVGIVGRSLSSERH